MTDSYWPPIDEAFLKVLEETYHEQCPGEDLTDSQIWMSVVELKVVRMLQSVYIEQQNTEA